MAADALRLAQEKLGHPLGRRKTDDKLAQAAIHGHLGRRSSGLAGTVTRRVHGTGTLRQGIEEQAPKGRVERALRSTLLRLQRTWYLRRAEQIDQGNTPWCVDATRCHWQLSLPTHGHLTHPLGDLYTQCKQIDPWPGQDGTSAEFMLQVCQELGLVASSWWYTGPQDADAALRWLTEVGGLWFGVMLPESAFRTSAQGLIVTEGDPWQYGHEMYLIGRTRNFHNMGPAIEGVQSWGVDNYGIRGRYWILERDFFDHWMNPDEGWGDLVGVVEAKA